MIDSVYKKDENYYPRVFSEKYSSNDIYNVGSDDSDNSYEKIPMKKIPTKKIRIKKIKCIIFKTTWPVFILKCMNFLFLNLFKKNNFSLGLKSSISQNIRNFFRVGFFVFRAWKIPFSWNIRSFFKKFYFLKYKKKYKEVPFPEI